MERETTTTNPKKKMSQQKPISMNAYVYKPKAPQFTMNPTVPLSTATSVPMSTKAAMASTLAATKAGLATTAATATTATTTAVTQVPHPQGPPHHGSCKFPWWLVIVLIGLIVIWFVWMWIKNRNKPSTKVLYVQEGQSVGDAAQQQQRTLVAAGPQGAVVASNTQPQPQPQPQSPQPTQQGSIPQWVPAAAAAGLGAAAGAAVGAAGTQLITNGTGADVTRLARERSPAFVMYRMNGCGPCATSYPEFCAAAKRLNVPSVIAELSTLPPNEIPPSGFPHFFYQRPDGSRSIYNGPRTQAAFVDWVNRQS